MTTVPRTAEYHFREYTLKPEAHHRYLHPTVLRLLSKYVADGVRLLDAGCGNGGFSAKVDSRFELCGVDLSESGVAATRRQCERGRFEVASVYDDFTELFGQTFDAAVSLEVIEHLYNPRELMQRLYEAVEPGGTLIVSTPYHGYLKDLTMALGGKLDAHHEALTVGGHVKFWSRATLSRLFDETGFDVLEFAGCGRLPGLWKSMVLVGRRRST